MAKIMKGVPGESMMGYFRRFFDEDPSLVKKKSNQQLIERWMQDHPGYTDHDLRRARQSLANTKSMLKRRKRGRRKKAEASSEATTNVNSMVHHTPRSRRSLEDLEVNIDNCLMMARGLDQAGLETVIRYLRLARNEVVLKNG